MALVSLSYENILYIRVYTVTRRIKRVDNAIYFFAENSEKNVTDLFDFYLVLYIYDAMCRERLHFLRRKETEELTIFLKTVKVNMSDMKYLEYWNKVTAAIHNSV